MGTDHFLIINADDFGLSPGVNRGIVRAFEEGVVTSASLMVRWPSAAEAARYARANPGLGVGLHLDLGEWAFRGGRWVRIYEVVPPGDDVAVRVEFRRQVDRFRELVGRDPDHLDSHQHVHREGAACEAASELATRLGVPLRHALPGIRYCGGFYGQDDEGEPYPEGVSFENLARLIEGLGPGSTEIACHPGEDDGLETMYRAEREQEVRTLCDPRVRDTVRRAGITLLTFRDVRPDGRPARIDRPAVAGERPRRPALHRDSA
jgi:predicted glycoside hydrolase/deacetylase ChbG (UPF0249 family)